MLHGLNPATGKEVPSVLRAVDSCERRRTARLPTAFVIAKISQDGIERPCMVRDLSSDGVRIQLAVPPRQGSRIKIEMRGLPARFATVRWCNGYAAGIAFDLPCDVAAIFSASANSEGEIARSPRFEIDDAVELILERGRMSGQLVDISIGGARLIVPEHVACGSRLLVVPNLSLPFGRIPAQVRWVQGDACGVRFDQPISSLSLARALESWRARKSA